MKNWNKIGMDEFDKLEIEEVFENDELYSTSPNAGIFYLYPLKSVIKNNNPELVKFSPNVVKIFFIDPDDKVEFVANSNFAKKMSYTTKQAMTHVDGEIAVYESFSSQIVTKDKLFSSLGFDKLYVVSEVELNTDEDIYKFGKLIESIEDKTNLTDIVSKEKFINLVEINSWTTKDGNNLIIRIGKQLEDIIVTGIEIKKPKTFLLNHFKILGYDENKNETFAEVESRNKLFPLWLNPIQITESGEVNFLNLWMHSGHLIKFDEASEFINQNKIANLISKEDIKTTKTLSVDLSYIDLSYSGVRDEIEDITISGITGRILVPNKPFNGLVSFTKYMKKSIGFDFTTTGKVELFETINSVPIFDIRYDVYSKYSAIYRLLEEVLTASYNYNNNFKGAGYVNNDSSQGLNKMALYKQQFEGKTIIEYIDGLEKAFEKKNLNIIKSQLYQNYKAIRKMLSLDINGTLSIAGGGCDDYKVLLPYFFEIKTAPVWNGKVNKEDDGSGIWTFIKVNKDSNNDFASDNANNIEVILNSEYFTFEQNNSKYSMLPIQKNISNSNIFTINNGLFLWENINKYIEETSIVSTKPIDLKLADNNITKYLFYTQCDMSNLYFSTNDVVLTRNIANEKLFDNSDYFFNVNKIKNPFCLDIAGIYGSGNFTFKIKYLKNDKENILIIKDLNLFKIDKQSISFLKINI